MHQESSLRLSKWSTHINSLTKHRPPPTLSSLRFPTPDTCCYLRCGIDPNMEIDTDGWVNQRLGDEHCSISILPLLISVPAHVCVLISANVNHRLIGNHISIENAKAREFQYRSSVYIDRNDYIVLRRAFYRFWMFWLGGRLPWVTARE